MNKLKPTLEIIIIYIIITLSGFITYNLLQTESEILRFFISDLVMTIVCFLFSVIMKNSSAYDAFWSYIPFLFIIQWYIVSHEFWGYSEFITAFIVSVWSWRLTMNWYRSWSGWNHEDWRYVNFRKKFGKHFQWINFSAIHLYPTLIVFISMTGLFNLFDNTITPLNGLIISGVCFSILGIVLEFLADNALYAHRKNPRIEKGVTLRRGLWKHSRNPNYLGEMLFWIGLAFIGMGAGSQWWTVLGALGMVLMFLFASIPMKEARLKSTRQDFDDYCKEVPRLIPSFKRVKKRL